MKAETLFRVIFGLLWLLYFVVRIYFQNKVKGMGDYVLVNEQQEKRFFRLFALAYLLMPLYFLTPWIDFARLPILEWLRWGGGIITLLGIGLFGWAHYILGLNWTAILALSSSHKLVTDGPYKSVRHPMYTAFFVIGIGFTLLSANWLVGVIYLGALWAMYQTRVAAEEKMMVERFGDDYQKYMERTGRLLPKFWK